MLPINYRYTTEYVVVMLFVTVRVCAVRVWVRVRVRERGRKRPQCASTSLLMGYTRLPHLQAEPCSVRRPNGVLLHSCPAR